MTDNVERYLEIFTEANAAIEGDSLDDLKELLEEHDIIDIIREVDDESVDDRIFVEIGTKEFSLLQISMVYGSYKCFNHLINIVKEDNVVNGFSSLHIATHILSHPPLDIEIYGTGYYIDQLLKKWGNDDIWINLRSSITGYTAFVQLLTVIDTDDELLTHINDKSFAVAKNMLSYTTLNVTLEDNDGNNALHFIKTRTADDMDLKNLITSHPSML